MSKPTCLKCYRLSKKNGEKVTCARCVVRIARKKPKRPIEGAK